MRTTAQIDADLAARRAELERVQGRRTEVYSRIVGYYRSLRNWNHGKKSEFVERVTYNAAESLNNREEHGDNHTGDAVHLQLFTRDNCPGCRVAKQLFATMPDVAGRVTEIDIDSDDGLSIAQREMIMVTPTLIARNRSGRELWRSTDPRNMQERLVAVESVSA